MAAPQLNVGDWYRFSGGDLFEIVAIDDDEGTIDIQYFDGTVEEMDREDWEAQWDEGALQAAEAPEDWTGSVDVEAADEDGRGSESRSSENINEDPTLRAAPLDGIDLFEFD